MNGVLQHSIMEETYTDTKYLIYNILKKFHDKYGGDFRELEAEANYLFTRAINTYNKTTRLSTWIHFCIWHGLLETLRRAKRQNHITMEDLPNEKYYIPTHFVEILDSCNKDSQYVLELVVTSTNLRMLTSIHRSRNQPAEKSLQKHLKKDLGWTNKRIRESFSEIKRVLNNR